MTVKTTSIENNVLVMEISIPLENAMLEGEAGIEKALNEAGVAASGELLKRFDTNDLIPRVALFKSDRSNSRAKAKLRKSIIPPTVIHE